MRRDGETVALRPAELAWIAALPCALATLLAIVLLGPPIGHALFAPHGAGLWPRSAPYVFGEPEPAKHGRYAVALLGPLLLTGVVLAGARRTLRLRPAAIRALVAASQLAGAALVIAAVVGQRTSVERVWRMFGVQTYVAACAAAVVLVLAMRATPADRLARWLHETRSRRIACAAVAVAVTLTWLLTAVNTDRSFGGGPFPDLPPWAMAEANAILDGRIPLADFHPLYGYLWGYLAAGAMSLLGSTVTVFTLLMTSGSALALLAIYVLLRRIVGRSALALALYLPLVAVAFYSPLAVGPVRFTNAAIFSVWPMRYGGPFLLAWLTARHLDGAAPRRAWPLFLLGGLVVVNNLEFGAGAVAGTLAAIVCARVPWSRRALRRLALEAAAGGVGAVLLASLIVLVAGGSLPRFGLLLEFPRLFGVLGLTAQPAATLGLHLVLYLTFVAAIGAAVVRVAERDEGRLLTGMLAWSGIFGLAAGGYFMGRSDGLKLAALFPAWGLSLALLLVVAVGALDARGWRRPTVAELGVLSLFGIAVCSLAQLPAPWSQISRIGKAVAVPSYAQPQLRAFVARETAPGEHVTILIPMGHRIAAQLGLVNVSPYGLIDEIATRRQLLTTLEALRREGAHKLFVAESRIAPEQRDLFARFDLSRRAGDGDYAMWGDGR